MRERSPSRHEASSKGSSKTFHNIQFEHSVWYVSRFYLSSSRAITDVLSDLQDSTGDFPGWGNEGGDGSWGIANGSRRQTVESLSSRWCVILSFIMFCFSNQIVQISSSAFAWCSATRLSHHCGHSTHADVRLCSSPPVAPIEWTSAARSK